MPRNTETTPPVGERPQLYKMPNRLKAKAKGKPPPQRESGADVIERVKWTPENHAALLDKYLGKLADFHAAAVAAPGEERAQYMSAMNKIADEIRRQSGLFDYPLIARFGSSLGDFTSVGAQRTDNHLKIVRAHIDAMRPVVRGKIKGDGGEIGLELL